MKRLLAPLMIILTMTSTTASGDNEPKLIDHTQLAALFNERDVDGAFVVLDVVRNVHHAVNPMRIGERRFPASTFKIANSLVALETGAVRDENEVIPYGGKPQPVKAWERDMSMRSAIRISNVPVFQELAKRIGADAYDEWLEKLDYGNRMTGGNRKGFWLRGPLEISPLEQVEFVAALAKGELPADTENQAIVRDILLIERRGEATLYGKSGWSISADPQIGWWVGWVERGDAVFAFALTIDVADREDVDKREPLLRALLKALDVYG